MKLADALLILTQFSVYFVQTQKGYTLLFFAFIQFVTVPPFPPLRKMERQMPWEGG